RADGACDWRCSICGCVVKRDVHPRIFPARGGVCGGDFGFGAKHTDFPHAVFEDVLVLIDAAVPGGGASEAAEHCQDAPSPLCAAAIGCQVDHRLEEDMRIDAAFGKTEPSLSNLVEKELAN